MIDPRVYLERYFAKSASSKRKTIICALYEDITNAIINKNRNIRQYVCLRKKDKIFLRDWFYI